MLKELQTEYFQYNCQFYCLTLNNKFFLSESSLYTTQTDETDIGNAW